MVQKQEKLMAWAALLAGGIIALQLAVILVKGETFCLNDGCRIVEGLTSIPPFFFNLCGLLYFLSVFAACRWLRNKPSQFLDWPRLLLLAGMAVEGVLTGYQLLVAQALCSYCLIIFFFIVLLNVLYGRQQLIIGVPLFLAVLSAFAALNFSPTALLSGNQSLASGSVAVKRCEQPYKQLYFFFSADCPHCQNVLNALQSCNNCEFHFNPIDRIETLPIDDLEYRSAYNPALNRLILGLLDIKAVPVLLVHNPEELSIIKGEKNIISFLNTACFPEYPPPSLVVPPQTQGEGTSAYAPEDSECNIEVECPEEESPPGWLPDRE